MIRVLLTAGAVLIAAGLVLAALQRLGLTPGNLPGDLAYRGKRVTVFAPFGTSLLLSLLLSLVLYLVARLRR